MKGIVVTVYCISCWAAEGWFCGTAQPEDFEGRSEVGTVQQLKDIPTETVSLKVCRLSSGLLVFHGLACPDPCQDTWKCCQLCQKYGCIFNGSDFLFNHTVLSRSCEENTRNLPLLKPIKPLLICIDPEEMMQKEMTLFPSVMSHTDKQCSC